MNDQEENRKSIIGLEYTAPYQGITGESFAGQTIMCVMNTDNKERKVNFDKYLERTKGFTGGKDIVSSATISTQFSIPSMMMQVIELTK